jgi:hypothetical protein
MRPNLVAALLILRRHPRLRRKTPPLSRAPPSLIRRGHRLPEQIDLTRSFASPSRISSANPRRQPSTEAPSLPGGRAASHPSSARLRIPAASPHLSRR